MSIAPTQAFTQACFTSTPNVAACNSAALADINYARATEGLGPLPLPGNYASLSTINQILAVANAERTTRGLPAFAQNLSLDQRAQQGAVAGTDPMGPNGYEWGSNYAFGYPTALAADFGWMYDDGRGSPNGGTPWGHRDNLLVHWGGTAGAGAFTSGGRVRLTELFVEG